MAAPRVIQGTWEDIASHAEELKGRDDLTLLIPEAALLAEVPRDADVVQTGGRRYTPPAPEERARKTKEMQELGAQGRIYKATRGPF